MIVLTPLKKFDIPVQAASINPDVFQGKSIAEIAALPLTDGNRQLQLCDLFKIEETPEQTPNITINGDCSKVKRIGEGMKTGEIVINGDAGMHTGEKMHGGKITINGNAGGWTASQMRGGLIEIHGNASDYLATPYRGSDTGMHGGVVIVDGNVGSDSACYMRGGVIKIKGSAGRFLGYHMSDGTIYVEKECAYRLAPCMTGGKIVIAGTLEEVMPTFTVDSVKPKVKIDDTQSVPGPFYVFLGDLAEHGNGKLFISKAKNPQLGPIYDKYL
ncbi:MAG TPA: formylmethanofuran dehydrogenase subunit C [Candidatus Nanoarchaeia archaeon]|nr:formylmethanofuran dehydrogenase subunit C [Candidatus Nanoarchaeia archaeon]